MEVGTGEKGVGEVSAAGGDAECKRGNAVLFKFTGSWYVSFSEIEITAVKGKIIPKPQRKRLSKDCILMMINHLIALFCKCARFSSWLINRKVIFANWLTVTSL